MLSKYLVSGLRCFVSQLKINFEKRKEVKISLLRMNPFCSLVVYILIPCLVGNHHSVINAS